MLANKFDDLLRQRFEEEDPDYNPAAWDKLAAVLPVAKPRRKLMAIWPVSIGIAASITGAAAILFPVPNSQPQKAAGELAATVSLFIHKPAAGPAPAAPVAFPALPIPTPAPSLNLPLLQAPVAYTIGSPALQSPVLPDTSAAAYEAESNMQRPATTIALNTTRPKTFNYPQDYETAEPAPAKRIVISLAGGMQYGSLNAGYAAAVNIRHNVGRRWYIDADMGYVMYNASGAQQVTFLNTPAIPGTPAARGKNMNAATKSTAVPLDVTTVETTGVDPEVPPTFRATQRPRIQYIQATPGIGYRVTEHFTVGASVDLQRALIENNSDAPPVEDAGGKVLPLMDLGAAGRVQWNITKGLKAGLLYRRGLNTALQGNSNYLDRHYLQFQLIVPVSKR